MTAGSADDTAGPGEPAGNVRPVPRLVLVRHGRAAAGWGEDVDPDLDDEGRQQAKEMAAVLAPSGPMRLISSPLLRARSTAVALEEAWATTATVEPRVGEIPSPDGPQGDLANRGPWLAGVMRSRWDDPALDAFLHEWREELIHSLTSISEDTTVTTHFVAINAAVGAATDNPAVTCFRPYYCSRTTFEVSRGRLTLVELGDEGASVVR